MKSAQRLVQPMFKSAVVEEVKHICSTVAVDQETAQVDAGDWMMIIAEEVQGSDLWLKMKRKKTEPEERHKDEDRRKRECIIFELLSFFLWIHVRYGSRMHADC